MPPLFPVLLDTCVLYPVWIRDVLLSLAQAELYEPLWSPQIMDELTENLGKLRPPPDAARLVAQMTQHFPDAMITGYDHLIPTMTCDPKDRHVLAAAVHARAQALVTSNLSDFPEASAEPYGIEVLHPDTFCLDLLDLAPELTIRAIEARAAQYKRQPRTLPEVLEHLKHPQRLPEFANGACRYVALRGWR